MRWKTPLVVCVTFLAVMIHSLVANAAQAQNSAPCAKRYKLAWQMPLSSSDVGRSPVQVFGQPKFSSVVRPRGDLKRLAIGRAPGGKVALQMNIKRGENKTVEFYLDPLGRVGANAACLSVDVYLEPGFKWPAQGTGGGTKMGWGLWGGDKASKVSGGTPPNQQLGWSVRNTNNTWGFRSYSYHLNRSGRYGQQGSPLARWESSDWRSGRWHNIQLEVKMNDLGKSNGYLQLWLDGKNRRTETGLQFRKKSSWAIRGLLFSDIWGGSTRDKKNWSPKAQKMWYANYRIYTGSGSSVASNSSSSSSVSTPQQSSGGGSFGPVAPSGTVGTSSLTLRWSPASKADKYYVKVETRKGGKTVFGSSAFPSRHCSGNACSLKIGGLSRNEYVWKVRPEYGSTKGNYSSMAFTVSSNASNASNSSSSSSVSTPQQSSGGGSFGPVAPSGTVGTSSLTLRWSPASKADKYYVKVETRKGGKTVFGSSAFPSRHCSGNACSLKIGGLSRNEYVWKVRPEYGSTKGNYSTLPFTVK